MPISARPASTIQRSRVVVSGVLVALLAALIAAGRITGDQIIGYVATVASLMLAGQVASMVTRRQVAPAERTLVPGASSRIDPLGTLIVPALLDVGLLGFFGWLRPLPSLPAQRGGRNALVLRALSSSATYLSVMITAAVIFRIAYHGEDVSSVSLISRIAFLTGFVNTWLLVTSLIPAPPLPGSVLLERILPVSAWARYARIRPHVAKGIVGFLLISVMLGLGTVSFFAQLIERLWLWLLLIGS